jgi:hypothetical protein
MHPNWGNLQVNSNRRQASVLMGTRADRIRARSWSLKQTGVDRTHSFCYKMIECDPSDGWRETFLISRRKSNKRTHLFSYGLVTVNGRFSFGSSMNYCSSRATDLVTVSIQTHVVGRSSLNVKRRRIKEKKRTLKVPNVFLSKMSCWSEHTIYCSSRSINHINLWEVK